MNYCRLCRRRSLAIHTMENRDEEDRKLNAHSSLTRSVGHVPPDPVDVGRHPRVDRRLPVAALPLGFE